MKPKLKYIFSDIPDIDIDSAVVDKILISRRRRRMKVILDGEFNENEVLEKGKLIKQQYRLNDVEFGKVELEPHKRHENTMYIDVEKDKMPYQAKAQIRERREKAAISEMIYGSKIRDNLIKISEINENSGRVAFNGRVFAIEYKDTKSKKNDKSWHIVIFDVTDFQDSVTVQMFIEDCEEKQEAFAELKSRLKIGADVVVRGNARYNDYAREVIVMANAVGEAPSVLPIRRDDAPVKRVELHMHTQMSAMDAVSSAKDIINRAISWGHTAVAITDHGVVQSYPDAMKASSNNEKIKILYGVEGYLIDDTKRITYNAVDQTIKSDFVVFDIETTGLSKYKNTITEIGAVKVSDGKIVDTWSTFVNPKVPIPENIVKLTSITDDMVKDAPTIEEILPEFLKFCEGSVLVAHNANFDVGFIEIAAKRMNIPTNLCYLDTMVLARCMYPNLPNHKLDTLTKYLNVVLENHHRAVDDAKATADMFVKMIAQLESENKINLNDLNEIYDVASASKRNKAFHIILLAKNQIGLRHIYEMVSDSHLKYFFRTPRIPKSLLTAKREGIIVGSACEAGELFRAIVEDEPDEKLEEIASFYDYLEIQPIGNNAYMKYDEKAPHTNITTDEQLQDFNRKVVAIGEKLNKPVAATCDVHFLDEYGANFRKILMYYKGFKDAVNQAPLFFRTTEEMLEEFSYLGKEKAYEVVVTNTNLIADMIDNVRPIPKEKCPPVIPGAKEGIIEDSNNKAKAIYGDPLPEIVKQRLDKELYSITTYGFAVMYRIAQELVRKSLSDGYLVGSRGSVGSSFVAFLSDITEVNSLPPHYICPNCKNSEFIIDSDAGVSGCDLPDKVCPKCGTQYKKDGHDIPFETFLGFKGDKEPDIDLNFSGEYQPVIHKYTETFFGEGFVFRAGTIGTVAEKTAFGYVQKFAEENGITIRNAEKKRLAMGCVGVKRTSGQHPGGIIVVPLKNNIHEFCPIQHPADDPNSDIITTHFDYHSIDQNLLKLDELGHDDPTVIRMLEDLTGISAQSISLDDKPTLSLFTSTEALNLQDDIGTKLGTYGVPEFGTKFVQQMLTDTQPTTFSELVRISGLSHGTDVWLNNAQDLIRDGITTLSHSICCRDDIMIYLISMGVEAGLAFKIMEAVRKGKGLKPEDEEAMRAANVPEWYLDSCKKIKYMFPKAHAVAYVTMAFRIAYFKVHYPVAFYIAYFSVRADDFDASTMAMGKETARAALNEIYEKKKNGTSSPKDESLIPILEIAIEMYCRGIEFVPINLYTSHATNFQPAEGGGILPPLSALPGMGDNAAKAIMAEREKAPFKNIEDLRRRTGATKTVIETLQQYNCLADLPESEQMTIFEL